MLTFGEEAVLHRLDEVQLILYNKIDEVRVEQYVVRRAERRVVAKEHRGRLGRPAIAQNTPDSRYETSSSIV